MNLKSNRRNTVLAICLVSLFLPALTASCFGKVNTADRAVEISQNAKNQVERSGMRLKKAADVLFKEFAQRTAELQKLINTRKELKAAGLLDKDDPQGRLRLSHLNAKILSQVAELKKAADHNLMPMLDSLEAFDSVAAKSLADTQATRTINNNYELLLANYLDGEKVRFDHAAREAEEALECTQNAETDQEKKRCQQHYLRSKTRIEKVMTRKKVFESRLRIAEINQKVASKIQERIKEEGGSISSKFREVLTKLYLAFGQIVPVAVMGGTDPGSAWGNAEFKSLTEMSSVLDTVDDSLAKLSMVIGEMVGDVTKDLDNVQVVAGNEVSGGSISFEDEMDYLRTAKESFESR